jgi:hypothetical protein
MSSDINRTCSKKLTASHLCKNSHGHLKFTTKQTILFVPRNSIIQQLYIQQQQIKTICINAIRGKKNVGKGIIRAGLVKVIMGVGSSRRIACVPEW